MTWRIYYTDCVVEGETVQDWLSAPNEGVQVVVSYENIDHQKWGHWPKDRKAWTGEDEYDPFRLGPQVGRVNPHKRLFQDMGDRPWRP